MREGIWLKPASTRVVTRSAPSASEAPRFVNTCTTPFAASEPYSEDAAAPLITSMRCTSWGAISASPKRVITPSTMNSGSCRPLMLVAPRRRSATSPPGCAEVGTRRTPATLPCSACSALVPGTACSSSALTVPTAKGSFLRSIASATPVTITSSRRSGSASSAKFCSCVPGLRVIVRDTGRCPMYRAVSTTCWPRTASAATVIV